MASLRIIRPPLRLLPAVLTCWLAAPDAFGQTAPDAGSILRDIERSTPPLSKPPAPVEPTPPTVETPPLKQGRAVRVTGFHIVATLFPEATLQGVVKDYIGRDCTLGELEEAAALIARYYRDHDRLAHAYLPKQTIHDGVIEIVVVEGKLGSVSVDPSSRARLDPEIAASRILAQQDVGDVLRPSALETGMASLNSLPGVAATAALVPGKGVGESDVVLKLRDTPLISTDLVADNASPRAVGSWRAVGQAALNDALGWGDLEQVTILKSHGSQFGRVGISAPVSRSGLTLAVSASYLDFAVDKEFNAAKPSGSATSAGVSATYPLLRGASLLADLTLAYEHREIVDRTASITTSDNLLDIATLSIGGSRRDEFLGGGVTTFEAGASLGNLDLGADPDNQAFDQVTARSAGLYGKFTATLGRVQPIAPRLELWLSASGQAAQKNLDNSEKFSLGGPTGVRAYPVNEANGDSGWLTTIELRYTVLPGLHIGPFFDAGGIIQHVHGWPDWQGGSSQPNRYELYGTGLSASWTPLPSVSIKGSVARTLGNNPGSTAGGYDADGYREKTRFWLQAAIHF